MAIKKIEKNPCELFGNCTTFYAGILNAHFHYCLFFKCKKTRKKLKNLIHPITCKDPSVTQFGSIWVRGVHCHPLGPHLTPGCPLTPITSLRCPLKSPDFRNVSKASSVTPIWKPLGQGSSLAPLKTTFDTWLPPGPFLKVQ